MDHRVDQLFAAAAEALGGFYLFGTTWGFFAYDALFGTLSLVAVTCGAVLGLHGVCRLVMPICKKGGRWYVPRSHDQEDAGSDAAS